VSVLRVLKMGNTSLSTPSLPLDNPEHPDHAFLTPLLKDMRDTMNKEGGVGIAAPQIGCNRRVILFGFEESDRYPDELSIPLTVLINPTIKYVSEEWMDGWEGCLSVPGLRGLVSRCTQIEYSGYDEHGALITRIVEGFHARVVQHECDHLDGILYPQRIKDFRYFGFEEALADALEGH
jgi:peptide deformylase